MADENNPNGGNGKNGKVGLVERVTTGVHIVGPNCGNGIEYMIEIVKEMRAAAGKTLVRRRHRRGGSLSGRADCGAARCRAPGTGAGGRSGRPPRFAPLGNRARRAGDRGRGDGRRTKRHLNPLTRMLRRQQAEAIVSLLAWCRARR